MCNLAPPLTLSLSKGEFVQAQTERGAMSLVMLTGMVAAVLTTIAFLPQVIRTWRTRSTSDISLGMFVTYVTGILLWLVYGLTLGDIPLIASNAVTFVPSGIILGPKPRHG